MAKFAKDKPHLSALLILPLCILCICCHGSSNGDYKCPLSESYKFTSDVTSVNLHDSILYLGLYSDQFVKFDPRNGNSKSYKLPSRLNNTKTYYIYPLSPDSFLVSKRNYGVTLVHYKNTDVCTLDTAISLRQDSVSKPFKGENYSSYNIYPFNGSLLVGSTNGLMIMPTSDIRNPLRFVPSLKHLRDSITQYTIEDICGVNDSVVDVYTRDIKWRFHNSTENPTEIVKPENKYRRCFENWTVSVGGDTLTKIDSSAVNTYYLGTLGIKQEKWPTLAILDSTLYYVSGGKLHSVYLPLLGLLNKSVYDPVTFVANDTDMMYLANNTGLYQVDSSDHPKYTHTIEMDNRISKGIIHNNTIYAIDGQNLYKISPKNRYSFTPIKPKQIVNIVKNNEQEDELTCIDINNNTIYIGSRNRIYRYDLTKDAIDASLLESQDTADNFINQYCTTISYPFAGTLNDGIHLINGNQFKKIQSGPKDIRKLVYQQSYLACQTNYTVRLYQWVDSIDKLSQIPKTIPCLSRDILDIALTNDTLYILTLENLLSISIKDEDISAKTNPGYTKLTNLGQKIISYNFLSVVDNHVLEPNPVEWWQVFAIAVIIVLLIGLIIILIKLQSRRKNPEYHSAKDIIVKLTKSIDCKNFLSAPIPSGNAGELRRLMSELLNTVINSSVANADEMIAANRQLVDLSKVIFGRFVELRSNLSLCKDTLDKKLKATDSIKTKSEAESFINKIVDITNNLKWSGLKLKDIDLIKLSISIISKLEKVYSEINSQIKADKIQALAEEIICKGNTEDAEDLADFLIIDKALVSTLLLKATGKSIFFWVKPLDSDPDRFKYSNKYNYMWNGMLLLSLTNINPKRIKKYLNDTFFPIMHNEDKDSAKEKSKNCEEIWKQLTDKSHNPITSFFSNRASQDVWNRESFIPAMPLDLVLISSVRFNDKEG